MLVAFFLIGLFLYGPDSMVSATAAVDFGTKKGAGSAAGFINGCGSFGQILGVALPGYLMAWFPGADTTVILLDRRTPKPRLGVIRGFRRSAQRPNPRFKAPGAPSVLGQSAFLFLSLPTELGTLDAIHLATALMWREAREEEIVMATHDRALSAAAQASGLRVVGLK